MQTIEGELESSTRGSQFWKLMGEFCDFLLDVLGRCKFLQNPGDVFRPFVVVIDDDVFIWNMCLGPRITNPGGSNRDLHGIQKDVILVITDIAPKQFANANLGLKSWTVPEFWRFRRLDIVVVVEK